MGRRVAALPAIAALLLVAAYPPPPPPSPGPGDDPAPPPATQPAPTVQAADIPLDEPPPPLGAPAPEAGTVSLYVDGDPSPIEFVAGPSALTAPLDAATCGFTEAELVELLPRILLATGADGTTYVIVSPLPLQEGTVVVSAEAPEVTVCAGRFAAGSTAALRLEEVILLDARRVDADGILLATVDVGTGTPPGLTTLGIAAWLADGDASHFYVPVLVLGVAAEVDTEAPEAPTVDAPAPVEEAAGGLADRWWIPVLLVLLVLFLVARSRRSGGGGGE